MSHFWSVWVWGNGGVGNYMAGLSTGLAVALATRVFKLHTRLRDWWHEPMHERFDRLEGKEKGQDR